MKKLLLLVALGLVFTAPAIAARRCMYMGVPSGAYTPGIRSVDWIEGNDEENAVTTEGIGICSANTLESGNYRDVLTQVGVAGNMQHCWCKMIRPDVSKWVFGKTYTSYSDCVGSCAEYCGFSVSYKEYIGNLI